jgi:hypothetical protein
MIIRGGQSSSTAYDEAQGTAVDEGGKCPR